MIARNHGHIINIVSSGAISGNAFTSSYSSSNAALLSKTKKRRKKTPNRFLFFIFLQDFTETLGQEMLLCGATGVRSTAILPFFLDGGIYTTFRKL